MPREFDITMLGPARAGKTSLLASVYHQFPDVGHAVDLQVKAIGEANDILESYVAYLQQTFDTPSRIPKNNGDLMPPTRIAGIPGTDIPYSFDLGLVGKHPKIRLVFRDFPGEQLQEREAKRAVIERVRRCAVTMVAVDTPALMIDSKSVLPVVYTNGRHASNEGSTGAAEIYNIFNAAYDQLPNSRLVLLVPIKCEKWVQDPRSAAELLARLRTNYELLLTFLASDRLKNKVAVAVTPVQTLGNVIYAHMATENVYSPRYLKKSIMSTYEPRYCEQPLRYALRFVLKRYLQDPGFWDGLLYSWFGRDEPFRKAIDQFAQDSIPRSGESEGAFAVLQGSHLL
jgi:hypothetical protein